MDTILNRFDNIVRDHPNDICLCEGNEQFTFADVQRISDNMAGELSGRTARETCVAWLGGAGAHRVLTYLAIQKAGLVFFAPNTTLNDEQICQTLAVAKPEVLLVDQEYEALAACIPHNKKIVASLARNDLRAFERPSVTKDAISHLSMTSGSTGIPKMLPRTRRDMEYFIDLACELQELKPSDTTALLGNLWNPTLFTGLNVGAKTVCFDVPRWGAGGLAEKMRDEHVTTAMMYPALFRELMATQTPLPDLRCIILIGEALTQDDAEAHARVCAPDAELINIYGSMEFPYLLQWRRRAADAIDFATMPMGREVVPGELHLINEHGEPAKDGAVGEIEITSHHVPTMYLDNPELTEERFRALPDGRTALRMGDFAYRDYAGIYHSMGRRDQQTKIRGYNVRPTDVEMIIKREHGILDCAVTTATTAQGIRKLVCFYSGSANDKALRKTLNQRLPNYMVPSIWRQLELLPKTPSGKLKRDALPDPFAVETGGNKCATYSATESKIAKLFTEILDRNDIAPDDDFFDLGGDSLQAMRLVMQTEKIFGRRPPFETLMLNGATIEDLARFFESERTQHPSVLREGMNGPTFVVTHTQDGNLSMYLPLTQSLDPRFRVVGANGREITGRKQAASMREMAQHSLDVLGDEVAPGKQIALVGFSYGGPIAVEMARILSERDGTTPPLILLDPHAVWNDRWRWSRRALEAAKTGNVSRLWNLGKMYALATSNGETDDLEEAHLVPWLSYKRDAALRHRALSPEAALIGVRGQSTWGCGRRSVRGERA
ncbi:MAG: AMP-binding protein, partial [Pseudomonadota bacterium]